MTDFLYKQVVDWFLAQLSQGELAPGDKMPSLRKLAKSLELSLNTVIHGYDILTQEGWIESRPKSGYFVCHKTTTKQAHVLAGDRVRVLEEEGNKLAWAALSHRAALVDQCDAFLATPVRSEDVTLPILGKGHLVAREAVAEHLMRVGIKAHPSHIWLGRSPMAFFTQAVQTLTQPGDRVLVLTPSDPRLTSCLKSLNRQVLCLACGERGVDLDEVVRCLRDDEIRLLVLPSQYAFPAGLEISNLSLRRWLALVKQVGVPAIEWDMTSHLGYKSSNVMTYKALDDENLVVYIGGAESKGVDRSAAWCLTGQYNQLEGAILSADLALNDGQQQALTDALNPQATHAFGKRARQVWSAVEKAKSELDQQLGDRIQIAPAKGGLALWVQLANPIAADDMTKLLAKHRHGLLPGYLATNEHDANYWLAINATYPEISALAAMLSDLLAIEETVIEETSIDPVVVAEPDAIDLEDTSLESIDPPELEQDTIEPEAEESPLEDVIQQDMSDMVLMDELDDADGLEHESIEAEGPEADNTEVDSSEVDSSEAESPAPSAKEAEEDKPESDEKTKKVESSHHYNPMLDLINHDFG